MRKFQQIIVLSIALLFATCKSQKLNSTDNLNTKKIDCSSIENNLQYKPRIIEMEDPTYVTKLKKFYPRLFYQVIVENPGIYDEFQIVLSNPSILRGKPPITFDFKINTDFCEKYGDYYYCYINQDDLNDKCNDLQKTTGSSYNPNCINDIDWTFKVRGKNSQCTNYGMFSDEIKSITLSCKSKNEEK